MHPTNLTTVRPVPMSYPRREAQAWIRFLSAVAVVGILAFALVGCDGTTAPEAQGAADSLQVTHPAPQVHELRACVVGIPSSPTCETCGVEPFRWDIEVILSTGDTVQTTADTAACQRIGFFPDTTRFLVEGVGGNGQELARWMTVDGDSVPFRWSGRVNADSIRVDPIEWDR